MRELLGHGECIFGVVDSYPADGPVPAATLREIEQRCLAWRWTLKPRTHRLRQVHGDFHPWNLLFRDGTDFSALDRSRGEWGDAADDVTCLTLNYLFFTNSGPRGDISAIVQRCAGAAWHRAGIP